MAVARLYSMAFHLQSIPQKVQSIPEAYRKKGNFVIIFYRKKSVYWGIIL